MKHELSDINPQKMDSQKWDMLLDLLEHPEKYSKPRRMNFWAMRSERTLSAADRDPTVSGFRQVEGKDEDAFD